MVRHKGKRYGFEVKLSDNPTISRSMTIAMQDLELEKLFIVIPGRGSADVARQSGAHRDAATAIG